MKSCWQENPLKRPTFACIVEQLEKILSLEYKVCFHVQNELSSFSFYLLVQNDFPLWVVSVYRSNCTH